MSTTSKEHISTYRAGPYIFIEEAKVLINEKHKVFIKARYRDYNPITMLGMVLARVRSRTFEVDFENRCILYKGEVFPAKNLNEIFKHLESLSLDNGVGSDVSDGQLL